MVYPCRNPSCDATFSHASNRCRHERQVHNDQLYVCDVCSSQFTHFHELMCHKKIHIQPSNPIYSGPCDRKIRHDRDPRAYCCTICDKGFARHDNLLRHMKRHESSDQYECCECKSVFTRMDTLNLHVRKRHSTQSGDGASGEKRQRIDDPKDHYSLTKIQSDYSEKFKTTSTRYKVTFHNVEQDSLPEILVTLRKVFSSLIDELTKHTEENDLIMMSVQNPELDFPISVPFMKRQNLNADIFLSEIERVLQSYQEFILDDTMEIDITHVEIPRGSGKRYDRKNIKLDEYLEKKRCVIRIQNKDNLCLARAIVTAKARMEEHPRWNSIRVGCVEQKDMAIQLHLDAGVPLGPCGIEEVKMFQSILHDYQLNIVSKSNFNSIIYSGPDNENRIYLYYHDNHFDIITSMPAFFDRNHWCTVCNKPYNLAAEHPCIDVCSCCFKMHEETGNEPWLTCKSCNRFFKGQLCYDHHVRQTDKGNSVCSKYQRCIHCGKTINRNRREKHTCGEVLCKTCNEHVPQDHRCYMKPVDIKGDTKTEDDMITTDNTDNGGGGVEDDEFIYIFFDFETMQEGGVHIPNLCVAHRVCGKCIDQEVESCEHCGERQTVFYGEQTRENFCDWLFSSDNKGAICMAHNAKGFDSYFLLKYLHDNAILPKIIYNGAKIMSLEVEKMKIKVIDSINFLPMPLSQLPSAFGLTSLCKGWFPHLANVKCNQQMKLTHLPAKNLYNPGGMKRKDRDAFEIWYATHSSDDFNLKDELLKYCISDVDILRRSCVQFRSLFMKTTSLGMGDPGIDPFRQCITIASVCNLVFRTRFLKPETIAIIPPHGYHPHQNQSIKALKWIKYVSAQENVRIQHAMNGKEMKIGKYPVDGYYERDGQKVVMQFQGCFWHGHLNCYARDIINPVNEKTMSELYTNTMERKKYIEDLGYKYREIWECDFERELLTNNAMKSFIDKLELVTSLNPRDAFFGGRTEGFQLYREAGIDEQIHYLDFTSLYPFINKYKAYPVGHPTIITEDIADIAQYNGLIKCKILPPRSLYLPVLPVKVNNKLLFALCRTCADTRQQVPCEHSDDERSFIGTWVTDEVKKAIEKGYKVQKVYEVWNFDKMEQYDHSTQSGGLFTEYVNSFLKLKQEASGWPEWCKSAADKQRYVSEYLSKEGIRLNPANIEKNPGLRSLTKLMLNSFWGKFGQRTNMTKTTYIDDPLKYFDMLTSSCITVSSARLVNDEMVAMNWCNKEDFIEPSARTNVIIAAYTTAHARIELYNLLDSLGDRILYCDTDSVLFTSSSKSSQYNPPLSDYLGGLTSELEPGCFISHFCTAGPKNYCYKLNTNKTCCKIRGITLNTKNSDLINYNIMSQMVKGTGPEKVTVVDNHKISRNKKETAIINKTEAKDYRVIFDKRVILQEYKTIPYGY